MIIPQVGVVVVRWPL